MWVQNQKTRLDFLLRRSRLYDHKATQQVLSDDTDVFVLFCSNVIKISWSSTKLYMDTFTDDYKLIGINKSVATNTKLNPSSIALHALYRCNSLLTVFYIDNQSS